MGGNQLSTILKTPVAAMRSVQIMRAFSAIEDAARRKPSLFEELIGGIIPDEIRRKAEAQHIIGMVTVPVEEHLELMRFKIQTLEAEREKKRPRKKLEPGEKQTILAMHREGCTIRQIMNHTHRPEGTVRHIIMMYKRGAC